MGTAQDADDLEDLDGPEALGSAAQGPPGPSGPRGPRQRDRGARWPAWSPAWARGPAGALVAAAGAAVLAAGVTAGHVRAVEGERRSTQEALLSLQAGTIAVSAAGRALSGGQPAVDVVVGLANHGPRPLEVSVLGLSTPGQLPARASAPVRIGPGTTVGVPLALALDCARVPDPGASPEADGLPGRAATSVSVRVGLPAGPRRLDLPVLAEVSRSLDADLSSACRPTAGTRTSTTWTYSSDGHVRISVRNESEEGTAPVVLALQPTAGLAPAARPALPLSVAPGRTALIDLSVDPDCAVVHDGYTSELHLVRVDEDGAVVADLSTGGFDPRTGVVTGTTAWLAREIARHCP